MTRQKTTFRHTYQWSDLGETHTGAIPSTVRVGGVDVPIDNETIQITAWQHECRPEGAWIRMGQDVSVKPTYWGDDLGRRSGTTGTTLEVLAPAGAQFLYNVYCPECGKIVATLTERELDHGRRPDLCHAGCADVSVG